MNNELKVSFYLKRECTSDKIYPIVGKIVIGRTIAQFGSKLKIEESLWNVKSGRAIGKSLIATELNREINSLNLLIHTHYKSILERTGKVTASDVKHAFQGIASNQKTLLILFEEVMQEFHSRIGIDRAQSTYSKYTNSYKQVKHFIQNKYNVQDIPLHQIDLSFIESFDFYLRVERKMASQSIIIIVILLQKVMRIALHQNLIAHPPFFGYKLVKPEFKIRSLTKEEFERLISTPLKSTSLNYIRDLFVFSSFTGIPHADLKKLTYKDILQEDDGSLWICSDRQKTGIPFNVKLLDVPTQIIEKYRGMAKDGGIFPILGQARINYALKIIAKHCQIDKVLTYHMSRHTFASQVCLSQGVPIETVSRMMGHLDIQTTQRYARVNNEKIGADMKKLSLRISNKYTFID